MADATTAASSVVSLPAVAHSFLVDSSGKEDTASVFQVPGLELAPGVVTKAGWKRISTRQWVRSFRDLVASLFAYPYNTFFDSFFLASGYYGDMVSDEMYQRYKSKYPQTAASERRRSSKVSRQSHLIRGTSASRATLMSMTSRSGALTSVETSRSESTIQVGGRKTLKAGGFHGMAKTATMLNKLEHAALDNEDTGGVKGNETGEKRSRKTRRVGMEPMDAEDPDPDGDQDGDKKKKKAKKTVRVPEESPSTPAIP